MSHKQAPNKIEAVVFDLDGTLIDTAPEFITIVQRLRASHGLAALDPVQVRKMVTNGSGALITLALGMTEEHPEYLTQRDIFLTLYGEILGAESKPYPGLPGLVKKLAEKNIPWGVATNKPRVYAARLMDTMAFEPAAGSLVTPDDVTHSKPHPESIVLSCKNLGVRPCNTLYIGDHKRDIDAGRHAGCFTIAATYGYLEDGDDPKLWDANAYVDSSEALAAMILEMLK